MADTELQAGSGGISRMRGGGSGKGVVPSGAFLASYFISITASSIALTSLISLIRSCLRKGGEYNQPS